MEQLRITNIQVGEQFAQSIFSATGQKLLTPGVPISPRHLAAMRRCEQTEVFLADSVEELVEAGVLDQFDDSELSVGQKSKREVLSSAGRVVLEPGQEVEEHHLDALAASGKAFSSKSSPNHRRERILLSDALVEDLERLAPELPIRVEPEERDDLLTPKDPTTWPNPDDLTDFRGSAVQRLRQSFARIEAGIPLHISIFDDLLDDLLDKLRCYPTQFTQLALLCPRREDYLPDHAFTVTVLSMAIAARMHWPWQNIRQVGLTGIVYDLGMLLVPERIRTGACALSTQDQTRVKRHPIFSLSMLQVIDGVEPIVQLAALQHQERENGTGYPKNLRKEQICDYARLLAVADTFAAATEPRHYRRPKLPYVAMEEIVRGASNTQFYKPAARALIQAAGLFPVGSFIRLSDGRNAKVICCNSQRLDRPSVQPIDRNGLRQGEPIDLAVDDFANLSVARSIPEPEL